MFKKLITFLLAFVIVLSPTASYPMSLGNAFSNLLGSGTAVSVNAPGRYSSGARNGFSAGGIEIRAPRASHAPALFSFTPPAVEAGCGGISATFGGFSFISGEEFEMMLKSLASGAAMGFVSMLAIKTLCPVCEAVIQFLKTAAQMAARLSKDSCRWGQEMGAKFMETVGLGDTGAKSRDYCSATEQKNNSSSDYLGLAETIGGLCSSMKSAVNTLLGTSGADKDSKKYQELACSVGELGNVTWTRLGVFIQGAEGQAGEDAYRQKLLWMNLMGIQMGYAGSGNEGSGKGAETTNPDGTKTSPDEVTPSACETAPGSWRETAQDGEEKSIYCPPRLDPADAMMLFMCGTESGKDTGTPTGIPAQGGGSYAEIARYCSTFFAKSTKSGTSASEDLNAGLVYHCQDGGIETKNCNRAALAPMSVLVQDKGFLVQVYKLLLDGVEAVRTNKEMPAETLKLIQVAPFPLYQAINAAAVYPAGAQDLISSIGTMVAEQMAIAYLDSMLKMTGNPVEGKRRCISAAQASQLLDAMASTKNITGQQKRQIAAAFALQESVTQQIRQVNLAIQKQVLSTDLLSTSQYSQSVSKAVSIVLPKQDKPNSLDSGDGQ